MKVAAHMPPARGITSSTARRMRSVTVPRTRVQALLKLLAWSIVRLRLPPILDTYRLARTLQRPICLSASLQAIPSSFTNHTVSVAMMTDTPGTTNWSRDWSLTVHTLPSWWITTFVRLTGSTTYSTRVPSASSYMSGRRSTHIYSRPLFQMTWLRFPPCYWEWLVLLSS